MVTRLQSAKGSFVQSPKGALETAIAEDECFVASFEVNEQLTLNPIGFDTSVGGPLDVDSVRPGGQPIGFVGFRFSTLGQPFPQGVFPSYEVLKNWYFTGQTSGAVWRPIDWGDFVFKYFEWNSFAVPPAPTNSGRYVATPPSAVDGDIEWYNEYYSLEVGGNTPVFDVQTNPGFGARDLRDVGFINGEQVDVCDTLTGGIHGAPMGVDSPVSVFACPGQFVSPVTYVRNETIVKSTMNPPLPVGVQITKVNSVRTPTGFVLDTSTIPIDTSPTISCFNVGPTAGYWTWFQDVPGATGSQDQVVWQARIYVDNSNPNLSQFTPGEYLFDLEYS